MPLTGDFAGLRKLQRSVESLATPEGEARVRMFAPVRSEVNALLNDEFARSVAPDGSTWQPTVRGRPALVSKKLPYAFSSRLDRGVLRFVGKTKRDLLTAHQEGHTFAARRAPAGGASRTETRKGRNGIAYTRTIRPGAMYFNGKGKLVKASRFAKIKKGRVVFARAHTVGQRVLPARKIAPEGSLPQRWVDGIERGLVVGMGIWAMRAQK